jgi:hypothetical protein
VYFNEHGSNAIFSAITSGSNFEKIVFKKFSDHRTEFLREICFRKVDLNFEKGYEILRNKFP